MDRIINQFKRIYSDHGDNDIDFSDQEAQLAQANLKLLQYTQELARAAENLNMSALRAALPTLKQ